MDAAADQQAAASGPPLLQLIEASLSDRQVLLLRARASGHGEDLPAELEVSLDGVALGIATGHPASAGVLNYTFQIRLDDAAAPGRQIALVPLLPSHLGTDAMDPVQAPLRGRLGPAAPVWFADATWTAEADVIAALRDERPAVLVFGDALPRAGARQWAPVANLACALRLAGYRTVLLHYGDTSDCADDADHVLRHFDVLHHHQLPVPAQSWRPELPGSMPAVDRTLTLALDGIAAASGAAMVIAATETALGAMDKLTTSAPRAALLPRNVALGPRMIFSPSPREKAVTALCSMLRHCALLVEDEGLRVEVSKWMPDAHAVVLPLGPALAAAAVPPQPGADTVVAVGPTAAAALRQAPPASGRIADLDDDAPLDRIAASLARARLLVGWTDGGLAGSLAWRMAAAQGVPRIGRAPVPLPGGLGHEAEVAALVTMLHARPEGGTGPPRGPPY